MAKELAPGDRAPAFRMPTDSQGEISLTALKGKPFILYFYPRDDTAGCTREALEFSAAKKKFDALDIEIVGVSKDTPTSHDKFKNKHKLKITLASDEDIKFADAYGVWGEKTLYGRKYMGMERATFLVDAKGVIRQIWRKVKVPGHVEAVLDAAKSL
ncbi:MAG TPA: thioredoxin-dependent thiol peroxidase [Rhizomicrobium sp.]|jgi:peroxiredoxin Q/BCP